MPTPSIALGPILPWLDLFGIAVFAATGTLAAARHRQAFITGALFGLVTGVGGGSIRDLLIGAPVFWLQNSTISLVCIAVTSFIWFTPSRWWRGSAIDWLDAAGLAAYAAFGTAKALQYGVPPVPATVMGVVTSCAGGMIRDMIAGQPSMLMRPEIYVSAAAVTAWAQLGLTLAGLPPFVAGLISTSLGFAMRGAAIHWKLALPMYRGDLD